jgi:7,8-dihydropterin-6-yl-methyl-4-(beta-D-ribofuranosyl)aminobenzene 5'-phosphate synthase
MPLRITTLSENTAGFPGVLAEWGLSILVETNDLKVLLDTGASIYVPHNAPIFGLDLSAIDKIVLSHGHYDHTGGLKEVLKQVGKQVEVIAHPDIWAQKYARGQGFERYIGVPFPIEDLENLGASFTMIREPVWITDNIVTTGEIPMTEEFEVLDRNLYVKENGNWRNDDLLDDRALIIKTDEGLVIILGCAHRGAINTVRHAQEITGVKSIHTVIGGTHLMNAGEVRVLRTGIALQELGVQRVGVSHCTGLHSAMLLAQQLGEAFFFNNTGTSITVP